MGSMSNPSNTNFPPYDGYRDCSQGICSIYCPQWCYLIFPPPPSFQSGDDDSGMNFSPLIIVVIGILASAFLLVSYYTIITKYCKRRGNESNTNINSSQESQSRNQSTTHHDHLQHANGGLDESLIKSIAVCKYMKGDGVVDGSDCAVCLSEFQEGESLRLLPKCGHAFHLPCIDTWLTSHSSCPLCRSHVMPGLPIPFQRRSESQIRSTNFNVSSLSFQRRNALVLVVEEAPQDNRVVTSENLREYPFHEMNMGIGIGQEVQEVRRSTSLGSMYCQNQNLLIADILRVEEDHDDHEREEVGPSKGENSNYTKRMNRSVSTGRFMFIRNDKGSVIPN
ncbi:RING-H2 finger protein ATL52-like [Rutidosis leptorrhynchoides]|uniref:RING-H2 finger protein ATL52-like n=1 Tax=Rutidosis leptorrhynchoides TaxID=125765 RepID=UPI003A9A6474